MLTFDKLWDLLELNGLSKTQFRVKLGISTGTLAKLGKNQYVSLDVIDKICDYFKCQPSDIMEHYKDESDYAEMIEYCKKYNLTPDQMREAIEFYREQNNN